MGGVDGLVGDLVDLVQNVEQVALRVGLHTLDAGEDLADDLLAWGGVWSITQTPQVQQQLAVDKPEKSTENAVLKHHTLSPPWSGPVLPAKWRLQRRSEFRSDRFRLFTLPQLPLIQYPKEQHPCQLGHILKGARTVGMAHDAANGFDCSVDRALGGQATPVSIL